MAGRQKIITFLQAREEIERARFQDWFLACCASVLSQLNPGLAGVVVNRVIDPPAARPRRAYEEAVQGRGYDIVLECWQEGVQGPEQLSAALEELGLSSWLAHRHEYRVDETVIVDRGIVPDAGTTPGIKYIGRLRFHADLPESAARRSWGVHGELAAAMFLKMTRYVQNFIAHPLRADVPQASGIPELYFDRIEDYMETPPGGHERIGHDLRHLIASGIRLYTIEHVLKKPPVAAAV